MVKLHVKKGDESTFLFETTVEIPIDHLLPEITNIYNGRLKIDRLCSEIQYLSKHGVMLPPNMIGLTDEQILELRLKDEWEDKCVPSGGPVERNDDIGRRNGKAPNESMAEVLNKTISEAKAAIDKKLVQSDKCIVMTTVKDAIDILRGAVMIVYPMGLPPHDPIRLEFEGQEDLSGTQASKEVIDVADATLWWAGKEFQRGKKLKDYIGKNEKTKIITKIQKKGQGMPAREPVVSQDDQKQMMAFAYRKQEEMKKLEEVTDDSYLETAWSDPSSLKKQFQGMTNIKWGPR